MTSDLRSGPGAQFVRRLGLFDVTMIVMGGIIGAGIFMNPHVVARIIPDTTVILSVWIAGGFIALIGGFVYAELAARKPVVGGEYAYIRDAFGPLMAFLYGWTQFLITQSGGLAAVAMTFARYFSQVVPVPLPDQGVAVGALALLTVVNCFGVKLGSSVQNLFMVLKLAAIFVLIAVGLFFFSGPAGSPGSIDSAAPPAAEVPAVSGAPANADSSGLLVLFGAALIPVLFAYGGWQIAGYIAGEMKRPETDLPRALVIGVIGVAILYTAVNGVCLLALGPGGLAANSAPASEVMRLALGPSGAFFIALGISVSTFGFLSHGILTVPRVYYAMATDGVFFKSIGRIHPKSRVPVAAVILQGVFAIAITLSGTYEDILSYVVSNNFIFFGVTALSVFVYRSRERNAAASADGAGPAGLTGSSGAAAMGARIPGHPWTTGLFVGICGYVVANTLYSYFLNAMIGIGILVAGIPVYMLWRRSPGAGPGPGSTGSGGGRA